jgi:DNA topoisomerase-3
MKTLILAEKPSVAGDIAAALGGFTQIDKTLRAGDALVGTCAAGQIVEVAARET